MPQRMCGINEYERSPEGSGMSAAATVILRLFQVVSLL